MQRITSLAARRQLGGLAAGAAGVRARRSGSTCRQQQQQHQQQPAAAHRHWAGAAGAGAAAGGRPPPAAEPGRRQCRRRLAFAGDKRRLFCSQPGADGPPRSSGQRPAISVVGIPDPLTWIRCKVQTSLIDLYFEIGINSEEFDRGVKQALVHVSDKMSRGRYHELHGIVSQEMMEYLEKKCDSLSAAQRRQLAVKMDDIIFVLPEDVNLVFDNFGRKFCSITMRFWLVSAHEGPDDPEGLKIFKVASSEDEGPQKKIATAVYEFHRELTRGASTDWTVTTVWHYSWSPTE